MVSRRNELEREIAFSEAQTRLQPTFNQLDFELICRHEQIEEENYDDRDRKHGFHTLAFNGENERK